MAGPFDQPSLDKAVTATPPQGQSQPATQQPKQEPSMAGPYSAIIGGNLGDFLSTAKALQNPYVHEANAAMGGNGLGQIGGMKAGVTLAELLAARALAHSGHPTAAKWLGYTIGAGNGAVTAHNLGLANYRPK